jgi:hypothetical protein
MLLIQIIIFWSNRDFIIQDSNSSNSLSSEINKRNIEELNVVIQDSGTYLFI